MNKEGRETPDYGSTGASHVDIEEDNLRPDLKTSTEIDLVKEVTEDIKVNVVSDSTEIDFENPQGEAQKMKPEQPQPPPNVITPVWQKVAIPQGFKKVAIVGCADSRDQAPYDDPSCEIWGVNNLFLQLDLQQLAGRLRWFEQHTFSFDGLFFRRRGKKDFRGTPVAQYMSGLAQLGCPV